MGTSNCCKFNEDKYEIHQITNQPRISPSKAEKKNSPQTIIDAHSLLLNKTEYYSRIKEIEQYCSSHPNYPTLELNIIASTSLFDSLHYSIKPDGMELTLRKKKDGIVFFGSKKNDPVDFVFPEADEKEDDDVFPHFMIFFSPSTSTYFIQDLDRGLGALMKISKYEIKERSLINIGESYIVISFEMSNLLTSEPEYEVTNITSGRETNKSMNHQGQIIIVCKIFNAKMNSQSSKSFAFKASDLTSSASAMNSKTITIGRSSSCDITIEDLLLSKLQCTIKVYNHKWFIYDGDGESASTNGTWVYLVDPWMIEDMLYFKANHTLFQVNLIKK